MVKIINKAAYVLLPENFNHTAWIYSIHDVAMFVLYVMRGRELTRTYNSITLCAWLDYSVALPDNCNSFPSKIHTMSNCP